MPVCALILVVAVLGASTAEPPPIRHFTCERAVGPIAVDGKMDEATWKAAKPITEFRLWETFGKPTEATSVRFAYDESHFYAFFTCADPDIFTLHEKRDSYIWESDCVELFLKPTPASPIYYEFEMSPTNALFDARFVNTGSGGFQRWAKWNSDIETAAQARGTVNEWRDKDEGYAVEIAIPLTTFAEAIGDKPLEGQTWKFAAVRVDGSVTLERMERSSTANCPDGDIHKKDGYFSLTFK